VSVTALRDTEKAIIGYLLIGTDNTAKRIEAEGCALEQVLREEKRGAGECPPEADKANQAKSDFISSMSHELRTRSMPFWVLPS
jgi:signal transduction histidine kinase